MVEQMLAAIRGNRVQKGHSVALKALGTDDDGIIIGIAARAGNVDADGDVVTTQALKAMSYGYTAGSERKFRINHKTDIECELVGSWVGAPILKSGRVLKAGEALPAGDPVIGVSFEKGAENAWLVAVRPRDRSIYEKAKSSELSGFSWGGYVERTSE